jgi:hypothetical protein
MANGDTPPVSLMDREGLNLDDENLQAVEVEALPGDLITNVEIEGIEIVREDDGGATLDFDPFRNRDREDDFYDNLAEFLPDSVLAQVSNEFICLWRALHSKKCTLTTLWGGQFVNLYRQSTLWCPMKATI